MNIGENLEHFDLRNREKKEIHTKKANFHVYEREIWYVKLGVNIGYEQNGKSLFRRPVLVLKKIGNMFFCVPLTTKGKDTFFYYKLQSDGFNLCSWIILSQAKTLDKKRFDEYLGKINASEFLHIKKILRDIYLPGSS